MSEKPILFSTEMVQAILRGDKTQTRRVVKPQPTKSKNSKDGWDYDIKGKWGINVPEKLIDCSFLGIKGKCPYGKVDDLLWVRETFCKFFYRINDSKGESYCYKADFDAADVKQIKEHGGRWKPSIHMPKSAARIWLRITDVRVERLNQITEEDAVKEGVETLFPKGHLHHEPNTFKNYTWHGDGGDDSFSGYSSALSAIESFASLWYKINGPESWKANPWVWVVEFEVVSKTGKP